jgi:hypothetical protein
MRVSCGNCGAVYETDVPAAAVRQIARCQECGVAALALEEDEPQEEQLGLNSSD